MKRKLNCTLLIDDDIPTNVYNKIIINEADIAEQVDTVTSAKEALDYLTNNNLGPNEERHPQPDLIFLDINMPGMNGWEFLDAYNNLPEAQKGKVVIMMLTTSLNPEDERRAREISLLAGFRSKPLTQEILDEVIEKFFPENV